MTGATAEAVQPLPRGRSLCLSLSLARARARVTETHLAAHDEKRPWEQKKHLAPQPQMQKATTTRSPGRSAVTSAPTLSTTPMNSWPSTSPALSPGIACA